MLLKRRGPRFIFRAPNGLVVSQVPHARGQRVLFLFCAFISSSLCDPCEYLLECVGEGAARSGLAGWGAWCDLHAAPGAEGGERVSADAAVFP